MTEQQLHTPHPVTPPPRVRGAVNRESPRPLLIDAREAAAMLSVSARKLWELTNCNAIPSRRIGRSVRYCPDELRAWIDLGCPTAPGSGEGVRDIARKGVGRG